MDEKKNLLKLDKRTKFARFLIANEAYDKFLNNIFEDLGNDQSFIDEGVDIGCAFVWADTPEGGDYWEYLDGKSGHLFYKKEGNENG